MIYMPKPRVLANVGDDNRVQNNEDLKRRKKMASMPSDANGDSQNWVLGRNS